MAILAVVGYIVTAVISAPVVVDPEIYPGEIAVYFDREKTCYTVVGIVPFIEMNERHSDGHTSMVLYGDIKPQQDIQNLMQKMVLNSTDSETSRTKNLEVLVQRGWLQPETFQANTFDEDYGHIYLAVLAIFLAFIAGISIGINVAFKMMGSDPQEPLEIPYVSTKKTFSDPIIKCKGGY